MISSFTDALVIVLSTLVGGICRILRYPLIWNASSLWSSDWLSWIVSNPFQSLLRRIEWKTWIFHEMEFCGSVPSLFISLNILLISKASHWHIFLYPLEPTFSIIIFASLWCHKKLMTSGSFPCISPFFYHDPANPGTEHLPTAPGNASAWSSALAPRRPPWPRAAARRPGAPPRWRRNRGRCRLRCDFFSRYGEPMEKLWETHGNLENQWKLWKNYGNLENLRKRWKQWKNYGIYGEPRENWWNLSGKLAQPTGTLDGN